MVWNQKLTSHHYDFAVKFHIKQLHHNQLKNQGKKRLCESAISCRHSMKHGPSRCQAERKKKPCSWSNYWTQVKLNSTNSFQNSMLSTCICAQNLPSRSALLHGQNFCECCYCRVHWEAWLQEENSFCIYSWGLCHVFPEIYMCLLHKHNVGPVGPNKCFSVRNLGQ